MKHILFILLAAFPTCNHCEPETFDAGRLSEKALQLVPYQDGNIVEMKHSGGQTINFTVSRATSPVEWTDCHSCCYTFLGEEDLTLLKPDYPLFEISISIVNYDTGQYECSFWINNASFNLPQSEYEYELIRLHDSMQFGKKYYHDVFQLFNMNDYLFNNTIEVDSLYYNQSDGILKISMTNDEYFEIAE